MIPFNPAEFCIPPKITKPELQVIPSERYQSYLTAAEQRGVLPMFYLELATGLRKGEIAALLWSDYDAQTQTILSLRTDTQHNSEKSQQQWN